MPTKKKPSMKISKKHFVVLILIIIFGLLYYFKGLFIAATVNGQPITRFSVISELEKKSGKQTLDSLVTKTLILQEANKRKITVSEKEVQDEMKKIEKNIETQGQKLDQLLKTQGLTKADLEEQIKLQKIVEKMFSKEITVSESEINQFVEANKQSIPSGADSAKVRQAAIEQIKQQKLNEKVQALVGQLKREAKINYFTTY